MLTFHLHQLRGFMLKPDDRDGTRVIQAPNSHRLIISFCRYINELIASFSSNQENCKLALIKDLSVQKVKVRRFLSHMQDRDLAAEYSYHITRKLE